MGNCRSDSAIVISEEKRNIKFAVPDTNESPLISGTSQQTDKTYLKVSNPDQEETTTRRKKIPLNESIPNKDGSTTSHTTQNSTTVPIEGTPVLSTEDMNDIKETIKTCWKEVDRQCQGYKGSTKHISHSSGWRIARVFVSSTFTDFHDEREILVKKVFPEIREWCEERHINLIDCDLRWGIPKEATTEETINTCLEELDRCHEETDGKPFFLGMVGKRYGWIPGDNEVSDEMRKRFQWVNKTSITFMEFLHGSLRCKSPNAAFFIRGNDIGYESLPENYIKRFVDADYLNQEHLNELKKRLKKDFPNQVFNYSCKIDGITVAEDTGRENVKLTGMDDFTNQAVQFLKKAITKTYGDKGLKKIMEYDIEIENQKLFIESKSEFVVGQNDLLITLKSYIQGEPLPNVPVSEKSKKGYIRDVGLWGNINESDNMIMCVKGHPGFGKSTLLAKLVSDLIKEGYDIFYHFVGCSGSSKNTQTMYRRLVRALENKVGVNENKKEGEAIKEDNSLPELKKKMKFLIPKLREEQTNLIIVLDAVNELSDSDTYTHMSWLPPQFPGNIKCIVSSADDSPTTISRLTEHPCYICEVGPITRETAELIIDHSLQKFNKKLDSEQLSMIISRSCATNPLWITLMTEELRIFGDFRNLNKKIDQISDSVESLLTAIINRLINEDDEGFVKQALILLVCSVDGIQTKDFSNLLGDIEKKEPLAPLYWARTRRILKPYIKEIGARENISFYHMEIHKAVQNLLNLHDYKDKKVWNEKLATYYLDWCKDKYTRASYVPRYCLMADFKSQLVNFIRCDPHSNEMSSWDRSQYMQRIRCNFSADPKGAFSIPVALCQFCSYSSEGLSPNSAYRNEECCIICGAYHGNWRATKAYFCSEHAFGQSRSFVNCMLCNQSVWTDGKGNVTYMGCNGKLCDDCGFGFTGQTCAMVPG